MVQGKRRHTKTDPRAFYCCLSSLCLTYCRKTRKGEKCLVKFLSEFNKSDSQQHQKIHSQLPYLTSPQLKASNTIAIHGLKMQTVSSAIEQSTNWKIKRSSVIRCCFPDQAPWAVCVSATDCELLWENGNFANHHCWIWNQNLQQLLSPWFWKLLRRWNTSK